ncbi:MAG: ABC transporter permease [Chloroflexota bacterium]|nr:ABC transporter permease [Chloroflexota bacterium]
MQRERRSERRLDPTGMTTGATGTVVLPEHRPRRRGARTIRPANPAVASIALFFLLVCAYFSLTTDTFLTGGNLLNLIRQSAPTLIVAVAMTFVITTAGIDLSVGSILALVSALLAIALRNGWPWPLAVLAVLALGAVVGALNGWFTAYEGIPAFIVTLASLSVVRGLALLLTEGYSIPMAPQSPAVQIGRGRLLGLPTPALLAAAVAVVGYVTLTRTRFGQYVTGIGTNAEAVRRSGVNVRRATLGVYLLSGTAAALAGVITAARLGSGSSNAGVGFELEVIAAVVLGGTNLFGGQGTIVGTILGALTIGVIGNGLILSHLSPFLTQIVTGLIILSAIWLNSRLFHPSISTSTIRRRARA